MTKSTETKYLKDYQSPAYSIEQTDLEFDLFEEHSLVYARLSGVPLKPEQPLVLEGEQLELLSVVLNGQTLTEQDYQLSPWQLILPPQSRPFTLELRTRIYPAQNTALTGLYQSSGNFCSQCEAEGFRRITYYPDRPDVLSRFTTLIRADKARYPILLSNGNRLEQGDLEAGRHYARWQDPFPKPCYLFALVAGRFDLRQGQFTTASGRQIELQLYVQPGFLDQTDYAMGALKRSMAWDEQVFGLEYDLDTYNIVAVEDFNMGAMENKGLNVFNTRYVLACPELATDDDHIAVEAVIAHEYFHNWTGNRVTCRDWFQLSLKEGLTVFRDQQFTGDLHGRAVKRIDDVNQLRTRQFVEDAGPMAHPVRPDSYIEMNNFYTVTIYEKGAELIRMLYELLGAAQFRQGMDCYFARHDGQAVTCDEFVQAMADVSGQDLSQFRLWYSQAGTPRVRAEGHYDPTAKQYRLRLRQECPETPGQTHKLPMLIPIKLGLLSAEGDVLSLGENQTERVLELNQNEQEWIFDAMDAPPIPSLLRDFSAPIRLDYDYQSDELAVLFARDPNRFNRWEAGQRLASRILLQALERQSLPDLSPLLMGFHQLLNESDLDSAFKAKAMQLPSEAYLGGLLAIEQPLAIHQWRQRLKAQIAEALESRLLDEYRSRYQVNHSLEPQAMADRALANQCLDYLLAFADGRHKNLAVAQYWQATNMTDRMAALRLVVNTSGIERDALLSDFERRFSAYPLVMDKWFGVQATSCLPDTLSQIDRLLQHPAFNLANPNKVRALIGSFAMNNPAQFHAEDGSGYRWLTERLLALDPINPQIAARLTSALSNWARHSLGRQGLMQQSLKRLLAQPGLSSDSFEIVSKSLP